MKNKNYDMLIGFYEGGGYQQAQQTDRYVSDFEKELRELINKHSRESISDTPDFILAEFMDKCLMAFSVASTQRDFFYKFIPNKLNSEQNVQECDATEAK